MKYDYIIAGSGCAGLSLLYRLLTDSELSKKNILVLDKDQKTQNDRTWCYWEKGSGLFESIVHYQWKSLEYKSEGFKQKFDLEEYSYKMVRGVDFYTHVLQFAKKFTTVDFQYGNIKSISGTLGSASVNTDIGSFEADFVFNSTPLFHPEMNTDNSLLQHFKGWEIKTKSPVFDSKVGTLMDFTVSQEHGDTFMYVLPTSSTEALIEYTLFSPVVLEAKAYEKALKNYISDVLKIDSYEIIHQEYGVIPMSLAKFEREIGPLQNVIQIGTAGGFTKASSGYTFQFIQTHTQKIVAQLRAGKTPMVNASFRDKTFDWYDRTVLEVILSKRMTGKEIFTQIFRESPINKVLAFLGNESTVMEDIQIMRKLPLFPFLISGIKQL
ncbi:MAG: lycopene beta-cyclase [Salibacteraceae bacterium]|jgi:lycopene beta-cyclase